MPSEFHVYAAEFAAAAAVALMQAAVYGRMIPDIPRAPLRWGCIAAYILTYAILQLLEAVLDKSFIFEHTWCTLMLGIFLSLLIFRRIDAPYLFVMACGAVVLLAAAVEWTLLMTVAGGWNVGIKVRWARCLQNPEHTVLKAV